MGSRVGSAVGAVMDTKNKVRDSASSLKENVKDLPTQAGYAVHSAKQKAKDNVSDFKRGVVEERENRQEQRTQKRNLHRENISQKNRNCRKHRKQNRQFMRMDQRQPELPEAMNALLPHLFQNLHRPIRSKRRI